MSAGRVLVVAYHFPPLGAIGTMRTLRLVRHLDAEGWDVTVLTAPADAGAAGVPLDTALFERVPPRVRIVRAPVGHQLTAFLPWQTRAATVSGTPATALTSRATQPRARVIQARETALRRAKAWARELLSTPDRLVGWLRPAVAVGLAEAKTRPPDVLVASSPPWTGQLVALRLAQRLGCPWVADFRDPWSRAPWREDKPVLSMRIAAWMERRVVRRADAVIFTTRANHADFVNTYGPVLARRFHVVPNGCDAEEFEGLEPHRQNGPVVLLHAGSLYGLRNPVPLFEALSRALGSGTLGPDDVRVSLLGPVAPRGIDVPAVIERLGLSAVVTVERRVPRRESLQRMVSAGALWLVQPGTTVSVPGKLYEYLAAGRPILAMTEEGETADLVRAAGGVVVPPADVDAIEVGLLETLRRARAPVAEISPDLYDGRRRSAEIACIVSEVAARPRGES